MFPHITQYLIPEEWNLQHLLLTRISANYRCLWSFSLVGLCLVSLSVLVHMSAGFIASIPNTCTYLPQLSESLTCDTNWSFPYGWSTLFYLLQHISVQLVHSI